MRIISKFHDYYDGGAVFGIDKSLVWCRDRREILLPEVARQKFNHFDGLVGFCGKIFPYMRSGDCEQITFGDDAKRFEYRRIDLRGWESTYERVERTSTYWQKDVNNQYDDLVSSKDLESLFLKYQTPVFVIETAVGFAQLMRRQPLLIVNPTLKDYHFYRLFDTTQAFQEIEMFRSNVLVSETMTVPPRNDEEIGTSKGFDRDSFRNSKKKSKKF